MYTVGGPPHFHLPDQLKAPHERRCYPFERATASMTRAHVGHRSSTGLEARLDTGHMSNLEGQWNTARVMVLVGLAKWPKTPGLIVPSERYSRPKVGIESQGLRPFEARPDAQLLVARQKPSNQHFERATANASEKTKPCFTPRLPL